MSKPTANLSVDLDNLWSYMKTHGDAGWESLPSYFDVVVPRILAMFETLDLKATVFVVGKDAEQPKNRVALRQIADAGSRNRQPLALAQTGVPDLQPHQDSQRSRPRGSRD